MPVRNFRPRGRLIQVSKRVSSAIHRVLGTGAPEHYDAFISYSRTDVVFARALEKVLERYTPPRDLELPNRTLQVFRDEGDLTGTEYFRAIEAKLEACDKMVLLCSPRARASEFVNDEIKRFITTKGADHVIPILVDGLPNHEAKGERADEAAFPDALLDAMEMPLATDYREWVPRGHRLSRAPFENQWFTMLANLFGISRERLEQRDRVRQARRRRWIALGALAIIVVLAGLGAVAWVQRNTARAALAESESRQLADRALDPPLGDPIYTMVHALEAADRAITFEAETALRAANRDHRVHATLHHEGALATAHLRPRIEGPGQTLTLTTDGRALWWNNEVGQVRADLTGDSLDATEARFDPTGAVAVIGHRSGVVRVWSPDGETARTIAAHRGRVNHLAVSPDGARLATAGQDGFVRLWSLPRGERIAESSIRGEPCAGDGNRFGGLTFSPDGTLLVAGVCDGRTHVRDGVTLSARRVLGPGGNVSGAQGVVFSQSGDRLAVIRGGTTQFWDVNTWGLMEDWRPGLFPEKIVFLHDDQRALALGVGPLAEWQATDTVTTFTPSGAQTVRDAVVGPTGRWLLMGGASRQATVWHIRSGRRVAQLDGHRGEIRDIDIAANGHWAVTASADSTVRVWQIDPVRHLPFPLTQRQDQFRYSTDGRYVLHWRTAQSMGGPVDIWDRIADTITMQIDTAVLEPGFAPGAMVTSTDVRKGILSIWDGGTGEFLQTIPGGAYHTFAPGGGHVARWGFDGRLTVWDLHTETADTVAGITYPSYVLFAQNGSRLAAATRDGLIRVWDHDHLTAPPRELRGHTGEIRYAAFHGDSLLITASADSTARIWHLEGDSTPHVLTGHTGAVLAVSIRRDGRQAVTSGADWTARVWTLDGDPKSLVLRGHTDAVDWVMYDPAEVHVLTKSQRDSTARMWNPGNGRQLAIIRDLDGHGIDWIWFEGDSLMTGTKGGTIQAHPVEFDALVQRVRDDLPVTLTRAHRARILGCTTPALAEQLGYRWCQRWFDRQ